MRMLSRLLAAFGLLALAAGAPAAADLLSPAQARPPQAAEPKPGGQAPGAGPGPQAELDPTRKPPPLRPGEPIPNAPQVSSGTGFVVARQRVMTNHHVIERCTAVRVRPADGGRDMPARVVAQDPRRDLALLAVEGDPGPPLPFRRSPAVRRGEQVVTYGFPLAGLLSSGPTLTTGEISALAGLGDNETQFQISAPVQQGNSGGPLLDLAGNVVGVIVSKLNAQRIAQRTGDIPQNVNFAVKGEEAIAFLRENRVEPMLADTGALRSAAEVGEVAHRSTLFVRCLRN
jgi:S1-C subfamily serine protease